MEAMLVQQFLIFGLPTLMFLVVYGADWLVKPFLERVSVDRLLFPLFFVFSQYTWNGAPASPPIELAHVLTLYGGLLILDWPIERFLPTPWPRVAFLLAMLNYFVYFTVSPYYPHELWVCLLRHIVGSLLFLGLAHVYVLYLTVEKVGLWWVAAANLLHGVLVLGLGVYIMSSGSLTVGLTTIIGCVPMFAQAVYPVFTRRSLGLDRQLFFAIVFPYIMYTEYSIYVAG